jgi:hypothetical protein
MTSNQKNGASRESTGNSGKEAGKGAGSETPTKAAGALEIRSIIAILLGIYGIVLLVMGAFFTSADDLTRADGVNLNLWTGVGLIVAALLFVLWIKLNPLEVPVDVERESKAKP